MIFTDLYSVESVTKGHPDKICDQISDGLLDEYMELDPCSHVAIECMGTGDTLIIGGEIESKADVPVERYCEELYDDITHLKSVKPIKVINMTSQQSPQLSKAVTGGGAGDQCIVYGYACDTPYNYLPYGYWLVSDIARRLDLFREKSHMFLPDGKVQAVVDGGKVVKLSINVQHEHCADLNLIRDGILKNVLQGIIAVDVSICEDGGFVSGGIENDTGLTGRKIIVDTYGGLVPHGGGAFSGKDPTKMDRSGAYMCRFVAKNIVANGLAKECCVSAAYEFGKEEPIMISVKTDEDNSDSIRECIQKKFDFRPEAIIERLNLRRTHYLPTATYGHFTDVSYPWEAIEIF